MKNVTCLLTTILASLEAHEGILTALATIVIAAFTWALARSTKKLWIETKASSKIAEKSATAALETAKSITVAERAYVKMSHHPPGLSAAPPPNSIYIVHIRVKNFGQTPATVTDLLLTKHLLPRDQRLPTAPDYSSRAEGEAPNIFLVRDDEFFTSFTFPISNGERSGIEDGTQTLWVYGYVDYRDSFGHRHRAGYARRFTGVLGGDNNLNFVIQRGYNYDRQREEGEGNDWNETN